MSIRPCRAIDRGPILRLIRGTMRRSPRIYTPEEANHLIPKLLVVLADMRRIRDAVSKEKDLCDIEELSSYGTLGRAAEEARERMDHFRVQIHRLEDEFEKHLKFFEETGCELKSIDPGLVDFYSRIRGALVFLCWREDEAEVRYWHPLTGGFTSRQPLP